MRARLQLKGRRFGKWSVARLHHVESGRTIWLCKCACGSSQTVAGYSLVRGDSRSCGCGRPGNLIHGMRHSPEYQAWCGMIARCTNRKDKSWENYGGRGIRVCVRWRKSFAAFFKNMGRRPSRRHSLDRRENDGNYTPQNCRWATRSQQNRNQRRWL
jgi:hypothetical protein